MKDGLYKACDYALIQGKVEKVGPVNAVEKASPVDAVERQVPNPKGPKIAGLARKVDSLIGAMTEMMRLEFGQQHPLPNPSQKALPAPLGPTENSRGSSRT